MKMTILPVLSEPSRYAYFFDFDGTLAEIATTPGQVVVDDRVRRVLAALFDRTGGAVAIVTGREIEAIDAFLHPLQLPAAGVHGYERRNNGGISRVSEIDPSAIRAVEQRLRAFADNNAGVLVEKKNGALAVHYRLRPELETECLLFLETATKDITDVILTRGKMVVEARFHRATKGTAIDDFLSERPFLGRVPFFAGDDITDEDAFVLVNSRGGLSMRVGSGQTAASAQVASVGAFLSWLQTLVELP